MRIFFKFFHVLTYNWQSNIVTYAINIHSITIDMILCFEMIQANCDSSSSTIWNRRLVARDYGTNQWIIRKLRFRENGDWEEDIRAVSISLVWVIREAGKNPGEWRVSVSAPLKSVKSWIEMKKKIERMREKEESSRDEYVRGQSSYIEIDSGREIYQYSERMREKCRERSPVNNGKVRQEVIEMKRRR